MAPDLAPMPTTATSSASLTSSHSLIPVRVIFTNDSDAPLDLNEVRMQFISANNDKIPAATLDDIHRRLFSTQSIQGRESRCPSAAAHHPSRQARR